MREETRLVQRSAAGLAASIAAFCRPPEPFLEDLLMGFQGIVVSDVSDCYGFALQGLFYLCSNHSYFLEDSFGVWPIVEWTICACLDVCAVIHGLRLVAIFCRSEHAEPVVGLASKALVTMWNWIEGTDLGESVRKAAADALFAMVQRFPDVIREMLRCNIFGGIKGVIEEASCHLRISLCCIVAQSVISASREESAEILALDFFGDFFQVILGARDSDITVLVLRAIKYALEYPMDCMPMFDEMNSVFEAYEPNTDEELRLTHEIFVLVQESLGEGQV
jgi:hypothetical protein